MSELIVEGDLTNVSDRQLNYIKSVLEERGYQNNKVIIEAVGEAGDNFIANVKRIIVEDQDGNTFKMIAKVAPTIETVRMMGNTEALFRNEHIMYTKVLPKYTQLEIAADIPPKERLRYAACYGSFQETPHEVILLEDLKESNFIMLDKLKSLDSDCVKSVLRNFALLHALGFALKNKEPDTFEDCKESLYDMWSHLEGREGTMTHFEYMENSSCRLLDSDVHKKAVKGAITGSLKNIVELAKSDKNSKHCIIQQGDAWTNNIMFKFDDKGTLLESVMIDYQVSKPTNPVADLLYMIFNCTEYEMRKEHFYDWIDYYHKELDNALSNFGLKANYIFPKDQLDVDLKRYGRSSFGVSMILAGVLSMKMEEASKMKLAMETGDEEALTNNANMVGKDPGTIVLYKKRLEGLINSYREFGLL